MDLALELAFAAALAVVAVSLAGVAFRRVPERFLLGSALALGVLTIVGAAVAGIGVAEDQADTDVLLVTVGGLAAAALCQTALLVAVRALHRIGDFDEVEEQARINLDVYLEERAQQRKGELDRILARESAESAHALGEQERRLAEERRDAVARQVEHARVELTEAVTGAQGRLESRLMAWTADLDRGQRELETQLTRLTRRQKEALAEYDRRLLDDAERLAAASEEQRRALAQLRGEFEQLVGEFVDEGRNELETHAAERRRALHEVSERLRARERALREQIDREEAESRSRVLAGQTEAERRQLAQLEKALDRAASRLSEEAERRFDSQIKQSREKSAERLSRELDKSIEEFVRQAEAEVSDRIVQLARQTADRMERRLRDVARAAEAQGEVAAERLRHVTERLDAALAAAEQRIAAYEDEVDVRLDAKLGEVERTVRAVERD